MALFFIYGRTRCTLKPPRSLSRLWIISSPFFFILPLLTPIQTHQVCFFSRKDPSFHPTNATTNRTTTITYQGIPNRIKIWDSEINFLLRTSNEYRSINHNQNRYPGYMDKKKTNASMRPPANPTMDVPGQ